MNNKNSSIYGILNNISNSEYKRTHDGRSICAFEEV